MNPIIQRIYGIRITTYIKMDRPSKTRARKSPNPSNINNSVITYTPHPVTPFEPDNVRSGPTPYMLVDDSVIITSSTS